MTDSVAGMIESIKHGSAVGVSDSLFQYRFGTTCWIIKNDAGTYRILCLIDVAGTCDEHNAYRSKLS